MKPIHSKEYAGTNHMANPEREWVPAVATDIRARFERMRLEAEKAKPPAKKANVRRMWK